MADCEDDAFDPVSLDAVETDAVPTLRGALAAAIRAGLVRLGWTHEQLADRCELDRKTVSRVVNGHRTPIATVERLLRGLGIESEVAHAIEDQTTDPGPDA